MTDQSSTAGPSSGHTNDHSQFQSTRPRPGQGGYPFFHNGDVLIVSPTGKQWKLHSLILAKATPGFEGIFNSFDPAHISKKHKEEGRMLKWKLEMVNEAEAVGTDPHGLKYKAFRPMSVSAKSAIMIPPNLNGLGATPMFDKIYDNFFRCCYNLAPIFNTDNSDPNRKEFILDATQLLQAACYLDGIAVVRVIVEAHLLRLGQVLWKHLAANPERWVHITARLQSPVMFKECMLHLVGGYHVPGRIDIRYVKSPEHGVMGDKVWKLVEKKAAELHDKKIRVERHLLEFYPSKMVHKEDEHTIPGRAVYASDIYLWQAITLFRQYIGSAFMSNYHHRAADGGLALYRSLGAANATYLRTLTLDRFHKSFDMSAKGKQCFIQAMEIIKTEVKPIVKPLLIDNSQQTRDASDPEPHVLLCTEILDEELPWLEADYSPNDADDYDMEGFR